MSFAQLGLLLNPKACQRKRSRNMQKSRRVCVLVKKRSIEITIKNKSERISPIFLKLFFCNFIIIEICSSEFCVLPSEGWAPPRLF